MKQKKKTKGKKTANRGRGGSRGGSRGRSRGKIVETVETFENVEKSTKRSKGRKSSGRGRGRGRGCGRGKVTDTHSSYPVPDFVAVTKQDKGFTAPSGQLAEHLANFFQNKTEIEYDVLVDKMKEVPEDQIFNLLGIKPKNSESSSGNDGSDDKNNSDELDKNKSDDITPEEEAEADSFMKELAEKGKKIAL